MAHEETSNTFKRHRYSPETPSQALGMVSRSVQIVEEVVFLDGLSGTGKTMMGPIISSFQRVEVQRMEHLFEHLCVLHHFGRIANDSVIALLRMYADMSLYNSMIGRESNFRWKDLSGVLRNPGGWRYLGRLWKEDGDAVLHRIRSLRPILHVHAHQILAVATPLFTAFGQRLRLVEMVRHPLYLLEHWKGFGGRMGVGIRDFEIWESFNGTELSWFAHGWEQRCLESNPSDRAIYMIDHLTTMIHQFIASLNQHDRDRILVIPFERFVVNPDPYIDELERFLGTSRTRWTGSVLRKQRIPRTLTFNGPDKPIYRRYSWNPHTGATSEDDELRRRWNVAATESSPEALQLLKRMSQEYEEEYISM